MVRTEPGAWSGRTEKEIEMKNVTGTLTARKIRTTSAGKKVRTVIVHEDGQTPVILGTSGIMAEEVGMLEGKAVQVQASDENYAWLIVSTKADGSLVVLDGDGLS